jgi:hypothetical protein
MKMKKVTNGSKVDHEENNQSDDIFGIQIKGDNVEIGEIPYQQRKETIGLEENTLTILFVALVLIFWAIFYFTAKLPTEDILYKHDLVSRVVCDKVLPFTDEIAKETTFSKSIKKIVVNDDGVEVSAVLDETTIDMPDDILKVEILTKVRDNCIISLNGQVTVKDLPNDRNETVYKYEVVGDKITVTEDSSDSKPFECTFSIESGISTLNFDRKAQFADSGIRTMVCVLSLLGIYFIIVKGIKYRRRVKEKARTKSFFLYIAQLFGILGMIYFILETIYIAYA